MPPDTLQPKAYCTNPGLLSFLLAPPGVSTRDPSSERRNYLGEKWPVISTETCDFHANTFGLFYMPQICYMGQTALLPFQRKECWGFFRWKIRRLRPGLNPRTLASTLPLDHRSRLIYSKLSASHVWFPVWNEDLLYWAVHKEHIHIIIYYVGHFSVLQNVIFNWLPPILLCLLL